MLPCFIHNQNAILHVKVMVKCSKKLVTKKTWGKVRDAFKTKNVTKLWKKFKMGGGRSVPKIKKSTIQNVDCFLMREGGLNFFNFSQIKMTEMWPLF